MRRLLGFACVVLVALVAWRLTRVDRDGAPISASAEGHAVEEGEPTRVELRTPGAVPLDAVGAETREVSDPVPRGPLVGQLVDAETRHPLRRDLMLLVGTPDNEVVVWMRAKEDGSFTNERPFPRGTVKAWVKDPDTGQLLVRHEAAFDPEADGPWLVPVPRPAEPVTSAVVSTSVERDTEDAPTTASVLGLVIDLDARRVEGAVVKVIPRTQPESGEPDEPNWCTTEEDGEFYSDGLTPGDHLVLVQGAFARAEPFVVTLAPGNNYLHEILLSCRSSPGPIRGTLVSSDRHDEPGGMLILRDLGSGKEWCAIASTMVIEGLTPRDGVTPFELVGIPPGEYELSVADLDGTGWEPRSVRVSPPMEGIEFRLASARSRLYGLRARDARSGAAIAKVFALEKIHGQWLGGSIESGEAELFAADRWLAYAPGYRPVFGDFSRAERVPSDEESVEAFQVDVELERGFGAAFVFKDLESDALLVPEFDGYFGANLAGVEVFADGRPVARSDADGLAVVSLEREPKQLTFALRGWHSVASKDEGGGFRLVHMARD